MQKNKFILLILTIISILPSYSHSKNKKYQQRWGISTAYLIQNSPFQEISTFQANSFWYAQGHKAWKAGDTGMGFALGFSYDIMNRSGFMFRIQGFLETTGWIAGIIDIGTGIRTTIARKYPFSIEVYLSIAQTGSKLSLIGLPNKTLPENINTYIGLFGFKTRVALEIPISKKGAFITPYVSYAVYPWKLSNLKADILINGIDKGGIFDSLQIGFELGSKF